MAQQVRKADRRKRSLHSKVSKLHIILTDDVVGCLDSALAGAEYVTKYKMSCHLEVQTSAWIKTLFTKTPFSRSRNLELPCFEKDHFQVGRRTPRDTPVPFYTRTSPWPKFTSRSERVKACHCCVCF